MIKLSLVLLILVIGTAILLSSSYTTSIHNLDLISHIVLFTFLDSTVENDSFSLIPKASGLTLDGAIGLSSVLSSNTAVTSDAPGPTYNPPLKKCDTASPDANNLNLGGFDIAKYIVTGKL